MLKLILRKVVENAIGQIGNMMNRIKDIQGTVRLKEMPLRHEELKKIKDLSGNQLIPDLVAPSAPRPMAPSTPRPVSIPSQSSIDTQLDALRRKLASL